MFTECCNITTHEVFMLISYLLRHVTHHMDLVLSAFQSCLSTFVNLSHLLLLNVISRLKLF